MYKHDNVWVPGSSPKWPKMCRVGR